MSTGVPPHRGAAVHSLVRLPPAWAAAEPQAWLALRAGLFGLIATAALDSFSHRLTFGYHLLWAIETTFMLAAGAIALWLGDKPVRWTGLAAVLGQVAQTLMQALGATTSLTTTFSLAKVSHLLGAIAFLLIILTVALRWPRRWLLWACAFQLTLVATFVAGLLDSGINPLAFATAANTWMLLAHCALLCGAVCVRSERVDAASSRLASMTAT